MLFAQNVSDEQKMSFVRNNQNLISHEGLIDVTSVHDAALAVRLVVKVKVRLDLALDAVRVRAKAETEEVEGWVDCGLLVSML